MKIMTDSPIRFPGLFGDWAITISSKAIDIGNGIYCRMQSRSKYGAKRPKQK